VIVLGENFLDVLQVRIFHRKYSLDRGGVESFEEPWERKERRPYLRAALSSTASS
jgi:hypothetical protein